jgi:hypothetical protein
MIANGRKASEALVSLQLTALLGGKLDEVSLDDLEKAFAKGSD